MTSFLQSIGEYQILEKLGRGGMADVYLAFDSKNNRRVALKLVEHGAGEDAQEIVAAERLGAELQAQLGTIEERVPAIHSFGDRDGFLCIDMEYVEGQDLSEIIRSGALEPRRAVEIAREICSILRKAHSMALQVGGRELRAIVHGDIKPKNVRIDPQGRVRVLDFGIAKGLSLTRRLTSNVFGSVSYSSPERLETGNIDEMSDLWSVGVVLYEMIAGRLPFEAPSTERLEKMVRSYAPPNPLGDVCPVELEQIVLKALARSPCRRYQNAEQFEADLTAFLGGEPTLAQQELEETRRTETDVDEETRRSSPVSGGTAVAQPASGAPSHRRPPNALANLWASSERFRRSMKALAIAIPSVLIFLVIWQGAEYRSALRLQPSLAQMDADEAWRQYQQISNRSFWGIATLPLRGPLIAVLHQSCDRVADEYRNSDYPKVREGDWIRCKRLMSHVLEVDRSDRKAAAMLEYANGHILRINHKDLEAVAAFQRAASLQPQWPDPYLGMARTYIYNLKDVERGLQALQRSQALGCSFGKREKGMMADAYMARGLQYWDGAVSLRDNEQEKDLLKKARDDLKQAVQSYSEIAPWGETTKQIRTAQDTLNQVEARLKTVDPPNLLFPWNWFKRE